MPRVRLSMSLLTLALLAPLVLSATGCTTYRESYAGVDSQRVWTAMVASAQNPQYDDWHIVENEVWASDEQARIEVYRRIRRDVRVPLGGTQRQERTLKHQMVLLEEDGAPVIQFYGRSGGVPAHEQAESFRFFDQVWAAMGLRPEDVKPQPTTQPTTQPAMPILTPEEAQDVQRELDEADGEGEPEVDIDDIGG